MAQSICRLGRFRLFEISAVAQMCVTPTRSATAPATDTFLGPMTSVFSAPATCDMSSIHSSADFFAQGPVRTDDGCLPPRWVVSGYYSPGVCPSDYTNACSHTEQGVETTICCPIQQTFTCASSIMSGLFSCGLYFSPTSTSISMIDINSSDDIPALVQQVVTVVAHGVQVRRTAQADFTGRPVKLHSESWDLFHEPPPSRPTSRNINKGPSFPAAITITIIPTSTPSTTISTILSMNNSPSPSTQSTSVAPSPAAQASALTSGAIAGISGGILGAMLSGVFGTWIYMRVRKMRSATRSSQHISKEPISKDDEPDAHAASYEVRHELDEQRNPSEMPSWDEHNPQGPNKPMAWELQGSSKSPTSGLPV
ncbi:hypothetical protein GGR52DRAFT_448537 [Hypoxylon sp. FL1284]|nr:hypothetical protein GGR52DRAFT_448537 [Hypoxylon sp. FL1284]